MPATENPAELIPAASPAPLVELVLDGLASELYRRAYGRALSEFFAWYQSNAPGESFTRAVLQRYRSHLVERSLAASINLHLAALRKLASEATTVFPRGTADLPGTESMGCRSPGPRCNMICCRLRQPVVGRTSGTTRTITLNYGMNSEVLPWFSRNL